RGYGRTCDRKNNCRSDRLDEAAAEASECKLHPHHADTRRSWAGRCTNGHSSTGNAATLAAASTIPAAKLNAEAVRSNGRMATTAAAAIVPTPSTVYSRTAK